MSGAYTGENAQNYHQTNGKLIFLNPAIERAIPNIGHGKERDGSCRTFDDLAEGTGFEPATRFLGYRFSRAALSTTQTPFLIVAF